MERPMHLAGTPPEGVASASDALAPSIPTFLLTFTLELTHHDVYSWRVVLTALLGGRHRDQMDVSPHTECPASNDPASILMQSTGS